MTGTSAASPPEAPLTVGRLALLSIPALLIGVLSALSLWALEALAGLLEDTLWTNTPGALGIQPDNPWWIFTVLTFTGVAKTSRFDQGEAFSESWRLERAAGDNQPWLVAGIRQNG